MLKSTNEVAFTTPNVAFDRINEVRSGFYQYFPIINTPNGKEGFIGFFTRADRIELRTDALNYIEGGNGCLLYTSPSPRDGLLSRMPSSA